MRLFHGGTELISAPEILTLTHTMDFGSGFYTTTNQEQAERFTPKAAKRKRLGVGVVSVYEFDLDGFSKAGLQLLEFEYPNEAWLDYVMENRDRSDLPNSYDVVAGPVANDDVYAVLDAYLAGILNKLQLIETLKIRKLFNQYVFRTVLALEYLVFIDGYDVDIEKWARHAR